MSLSVRARIVIVMSLVLTVSLLGGVLASWTYARAAAFSRDARDATQEAAMATKASGLVTSFFAEASNLALGVAHASTSEEQSAAYGAVNGSDKAASASLERLARALPQDQTAGIVRDWGVLRNDVFHWINSESAESGVPLRMTRDEDGRYVASVRTSIVPSPALSGLGTSDLRRVVRARQEQFRDGELRRIAASAESRARDAVAAEATAREAARMATYGAILASILVGLIAGLWLYWSIAGPLVRAKVFAAKVRSGDLSASIERHQDDEIGDLTHAVEQMKDSVVARLDTMREVAGVVIVLTEHLVQSLGHAATIAQERVPGSPLIDDIGEARKDALSLSRLAGQLLDR